MNKKHILCNQTYLINSIFDAQWWDLEAEVIYPRCYIHNDTNKVISEGEYDNLDETQSGAYAFYCPEIKQWWLVTDWLGDKLIQHGQPVLQNEYGTWWGRGYTFDTFEHDAVLKSIGVEADDQ